MPIVVLNNGSSTIKFSIFETDETVGASAPRCLFDVELSGLGLPAGRLIVSARGAEERQIASDIMSVSSVAGALRLIFAWMASHLESPVAAIGYRVVHPCTTLRDHQLIMVEVFEALRNAASLALLHDPDTVVLIEETMRRWKAKHFAWFDTLFHTTMPDAAYAYAVPDVYRNCGLRRYGFHGLSRDSTKRSMQANGVKLPRRMVIAHLRSGCGKTALLDARSVDASMGLTPTGGVACWLGGLMRIARTIAEWNGLHRLWAANQPGRIEVRRSPYSFAGRPDDRLSCDPHGRVIPKLTAPITAPTSQEYS